MTTYVYRDGELVEKHLAAPLSAGPAVVRDIAAYKSPLGNGWIDGRRAQREDLARGGCRLVERSEFRDFPKGGEFQNKRFIEKHGIRSDGGK